MIYFVSDGDFVKIGFSDEPEQRLLELQVGNPRTLLLIATMPGCKEIELCLHATFARFRHRGEWFFLSASIREFIAKGCPSNELLAIQIKNKNDAVQGTQPEPKTPDLLEPRIPVTDKIVAHLRDRLKDGPVEGGILIKEVKDMGFSMGALYDAKERLAIKNGRQGKRSLWEIA